MTERIITLKEKDCIKLIQQNWKLLTPETQQLLEQIGISEVE